MGHTKYKDPVYNGPSRCMNLVDGLLADLEELTEGLLNPQFMEEDIPKKKRHRLGPRPRDDRLYAYHKVMQWDHKLFKRVFRVSRRVFFDILHRMINAYPGKSGSGRDNYLRALTKGKNATPWGPVIMEVKLMIFLRLLAGGSYIDLI